MARFSVIIAVAMLTIIININFGHMVVFDKVCSTNDEGHCNVESSLLILFIICNLVYVQVLLQVAHL